MYYDKLMFIEGFPGPRKGANVNYAMLYNFKCHFLICDKFIYYSMLVNLLISINT